MTINQLRFITAALLVLILATRSYHMFYYVAVFVGSIEFLNHQKAFKTLPNFKLFNAIFIIYLTFVIVNRSRHIKFSDYTEGVINIAEHGFFALIICLKLLLYFHLFSNYSIRLKAILVAFIFNFIGIINEVFQSWLNQRALFAFIEDARKDLIINFLGTVLFLILLALNHFFTIRK